MEKAMISKVNKVLFAAALCVILIPVLLTLKDTDKPNVVVIVIDTLRADHLSFGGYKKNTSPFLSEFAGTAVVFEKALATSCWTAPSTASIFTSTYPFQNGVVTGFLAYRREKGVDPHVKLNRIPAEMTTIAEVHKDAGYKTFAVTDNLNICKAEGFDQGFDRFQNYNYETADAVNKQLKLWEK